MPPSSSRPEFVFGAGWAAYEGQSADHESHAHVAVQLAVARSGCVHAVLDHDREMSGKALILAPRVRHRMTCDQGAVLFVYLETHTPLALKLVALIAPAEAGVAPASVCDRLLPNVPTERVIDRLRADLGAWNASLDPRLEWALLMASKDPAPGAIARAAVAINLSPARLRALAQAQLSAPLSQWLLWRKLERSGRAMASGARLAEAALAGGFADQAHLSRTMKRMFGVTPLQAAQVVQTTDNRFVQQATSDGIMMGSQGSVRCLLSASSFAWVMRPCSSSGFSGPPSA